MRVAVVRHWFVTRKGSERRAVERGGRRGCALRQVRAPNGAAYNRDMQGMRDVLRGSLGRSLRALSDEDRLAAAWPVACGSVLAERAEVLELDGDGVLHVRVLQAGWREQFVQMRTVLTDDLRRIAGVRLQRIHFEGQGTKNVRGGDGAAATHEMRQARARLRKGVGTDR